MNPQDRKSFLQIVIGFAELKGKVLSAPALELFWNAMQAWSIEDFQLAANELIRTCAFMPTPKDFADLRKAGARTAGEVFGALAQWFEYSPHGYRLKPNTPQAIASAVRAIGGCDAYMLCDVDKLQFLERRFCQHYEQISDAQGTRDALPEIACEEPAPARIAGTLRKIGGG